MTFPVLACSRYLKISKYIRLISSKQHLGDQPFPPHALYLFPGQQGYHMAAPCAWSFSLAERVDRQAFFRDRDLGIFPCRASSPMVVIVFKILQNNQTHRNMSNPQQAAQHVSVLLGSPVSILWQAMVLIRHFLTRCECTSQVPRKDGILQEDS